MKNLAGVLVALALASCASGAEERIVAPLATTPVELPSFDSDRGIGWSSSQAEYDAARADERFIMEQFVYESDGLNVGAYLYRPRDVRGSRRPVIVYNRGSYTRPNGFAGDMLVMANRFAQAGFIVVAPHLRGSNGWAGRDELGGADLHDISNVVPAIARIPGADPSRLYLAGESRGGAMVYMALRDGFPAQAAAVWGAFTDMEPLLESGGTAQLARQIWPDLNERRAEIIATRSALHFADQIDTPVLIMHGVEDQDMAISHSRRMDAELTRLGKVHRFIEFEGEHHRIGGRGAERDAATVEWFRRYGAN